MQISPPPRRLEEEEETVAVLPSTSSSSLSGDTVFQTPKKAIVKIQDDEEKLKQLGRKHNGELAGPFLSPYLKDMKLLDTRYGILREGDHFKIGNATVTIDNGSNLIVRGKQFKGTEGLWTLLTRKDVNYDEIDENELRKYKTILEMTNAHLEGYRSGGDI